MRGRSNRVGVCRHASGPGCRGTKEAMSDSQESAAQL